MKLLAWWSHPFRGTMTLNRLRSLLPLAAISLGVGGLAIVTAAIVACPGPGNPTYTVLKDVIPLVITIPGAAFANGFARTPATGWAGSAARSSPTRGTTARSRSSSGAYMLLDGCPPGPYKHQRPLVEARPEA